LKFYSEKLDKLYDTQDELVKAESAENDKKAKREARAKEVEMALNAAQASAKKAHDLLVAFCQDYGAYHTSISKPGDFNIMNVFDWLL